MSRRDAFLVELRTEELPPKALRALEEAFCEGIRTRIDAAGLRDLLGRIEATSGGL